LPRHPLRSEAPSVDMRRHTHRYDEPCCPSLAQPPRKAIFTVLRGDTWSQNLLEEWRVFLSDWMFPIAEKAL
jgi:hypothetical protein